jgi:hypothetical protein
METDPRAEELNNLRLALAIFALHLDAFEARLKNPSSTSSIAVWPTLSEPALADKIVSAIKSAMLAQSQVTNAIVATKATTAAATATANAMLIESIASRRD